MDDIDIVEKDILHNNRNVIKAFKNNDIELVKKCYDDIKNISSFNIQYNP